MFCSFPHRHGEAIGKPETRDKTRRNIKTSISYETSSNFHSSKHAERTSFAASPIDTATPPENQRLETRRVGAAKRAFPARLLPIFALCSFKIDVFLRVFLGTSKFCYLKIDVSCEASVNFQHMSQNATPNAALPMRFAKNTQRDTSKVLRLPRKMTMDMSKVLRLPRKLQHIFWKRRKSIAPATQNDFRHVAEHVWTWGTFWSQKRKPKAVWPNGHEKRVWPWKKYVAVKKRFGREKVCIWPWKSVEWPWKHVKNMKTNIENHLAVKRAFGCEHVFSWTRAACTHFSWPNGSPGM